MGIMTNDSQISIINNLCLPLISRFPLSHFQLKKKKSLIAGSQKQPENIYNLFENVK